MMLVDLPALDTVGVAVPAFTPFPSFNLGVFHALCKPSTWIVLLATLVILSSIRAAFLFVRPHSWTDGRKSVSFLAIGKEGLTSKPLEVPSLDSEARSQEEKGKTPSGTKSTVPAEPKKIHSWCWGLVKWESPCPTNPSVSDRARWQPPAAQIQQTRRPPPAYNHPLPALYDTQVPISMAKLIMSHHTFRRPTNRPPPVRPTNAPQYQRKTPNMV